MLLWLRQRLPRKNLFLFKLSVLSAVTHLVFCFGFFFMYKEYHHSLLLQVHAKHNPDDVIVRLLPLSGKKPRARAATKRTMNAVNKKAVQKPVVQKKTLLRSKELRRAGAEKKAPPKVEPKKVENKVEQKIAPKEEKKPKVVEKKETKPLEKKQEVKPKLVETVKKIESKQELQKIEQKPLVQEPVKEELVESIEENVRYVTHKELRGIELENAVQKAVQEVWSPPIGIDKEVVSEVLVTIGWDGKLVETKMLKLSEIVIYDVAVQEALEEISFPRQIWGKQIKIAFRP